MSISQFIAKTINIYDIFWFILNVNWLFFYNFI